MEELLKPSQVSKILAVSRPYVYKLVACGMLPAVVWQTPGSGPNRKVIRIRPSDVEKFKADHLKTP